MTAKIISSSRHAECVKTLALSRQQAIIWTNDGKFIDAYMHHSAWMS